MSQVKVKVPGKIMLAGEYAVLDGAPAISVAVNRMMTITAKRSTYRWLVESDLWQDRLNLDRVPEEWSQNPLIGLLRFARSKWRLPPFEVSVKAEFSIQDGLGSSSALRLGTLFALNQLFPAQSYSMIGTGEGLANWWHIPKLAWRIQSTDQGFASGYDIVTQFCGGWVHFQPDYNNWPGVVKKYNPSPIPWIKVFRGGRGAPTKTVTLSTREWLKQEGRHEQLHSLSNHLVLRMEESLTTDNMAINLSPLFAAIQQHRQFFASSPHFPSHLAERLQSVPGLDQTWSYKTTGAGGEDVLLVFGFENDCKGASQALHEAGWEEFKIDLGCSGVEMISSNGSFFVPGDQTWQI